MNLSDMPNSLKSLSFAWYLHEDWKRWCEICPDMHPDYNHWLRWAEGKFEEFQSSGQRIKKVVIKPEEFIEWTRVNGGKVDTTSRAGFAAFKSTINDTCH